MQKACVILTGFVIVVSLVGKIFATSNGLHLTVDIDNTFPGISMLNQSVSE